MIVTQRVVSPVHGTCVTTRMVWLVVIIVLHETRLVCRRQKPCPHSVSDHHLVLFLSDPLHNNISHTIIVRNVRDDEADSNDYIVLVL